jgi:outer membrane lipoprotein LolB
MPVASHGGCSCRRAAPLGLLATILVSGCAILAPAETPLQVYTGRFSASIHRDARRDAVSGRFVLATFPDRTTLDLASPIGNTLARVEAGARGATLTAPKEDGALATWHGRDADELAESAIGFRLPVSGLPDWIAGRAVAGRPAQSTPDIGRPQRIEQDGWVIVIEERFAETGLPRRLSLDRGTDTGSGASLRLRLVLDPVQGAAEEPSRQ